MGASATDADDNDRAALALSRFMEKMGVPRGEVFLEEGSGLSRKNLVTPRATVRLLRGMDASPAAMPWRAALPVGGVDGTLKSRFTDPAIKGRVVAKTGTLRHVHSLAGYITTAAGQRLAFALFVNGHASTDNAASGRAEVERIAARLAAFQGRGPQ
jgi:D-alanyl-D-alanine carboxypeptidase/D-alanyl-D-alanine-endopeptidase (penicillin-binding protein 4)